MNNNLDLNLVKFSQESQITERERLAARTAREVEMQGLASEAVVPPAEGSLEPSGLSGMGPGASVLSPACVDAGAAAVVTGSGAAVVAGGS